jgi:pimeloyl-ACP methyl ester carboxylesterase
MVEERADERIADGHGQPDSGFPVEHVTIHGQRIAYRRGGEGPALLFLHGIAGSSQIWVPAMELLRAEYTMVAPDFLGHGHSAKPMGDYSLGNFASSMRDLLQMLDIDRVTVVGQSFGGGVAMQFAYQFPERCERLVLVDAGGLGREVSWVLRMVTLPGVEYVLPALFRQPPRLSANHAIGDRAGRPVGQCDGPSLPGRADTDAHRVGRKGQNHPPLPCLPGARSDAQQSVGSTSRCQPFPPGGGSRQVRRGSERVLADHRAQQVRLRGSARAAPTRSDQPLIRAPANRRVTYAFRCCLSRKPTLRTSSASSRPLAGMTSRSGDGQDRQRGEGDDPAVPPVPAQLPEARSSAGADHDCVCRRVGCRGDDGPCHMTVVRLRTVPLAAILSCRSCSTALTTRRVASSSVYSGTPRPAAMN